jgi:hypothetical protein
VYTPTSRCGLLKTPTWGVASTIASTPLHASSHPACSSSHSASHSSCQDTQSSSTSESRRECIDTSRPAFPFPAASSQPLPQPPPWCRRPQTICKLSAFSHSRQNNALQATQPPLNMYARSSKEHPLQHVHPVNYIHAQQNNLNSAFTHSLFHEHNFVGTKLCTGLTTFTIHSTLVSLSHILPLPTIDHATISTHMHAHTTFPVCYTK